MAAAGERIESFMMILCSFKSSETENRNTLMKIDCNVRRLRREERKMNSRMERQLNIKASGLFFIALNGLPHRSGNCQVF